MMPKKLKTVNLVMDTTIRDALDTHARAINALIEGDTELDTSWQVVGERGMPQFQNSWHNYGTPYAPLSYRKDTAGYVHMQGRIIGGEIDTVVFNLPLGYRPATTLVIASPMGGSGWIQINADGDVRIITP